MRALTVFSIALVLLVAPATVIARSSQAAALPSATPGPRLITLSGVFRPADGGRPNAVETITVAIYAEETGGAPLWQETQTIEIETTGRYSLLLGATEADGVPLGIFASGEARWLSSSWSRAGEVEGLRTRLTSVPYALRASDAETLGGRPASAYQLAPLAAPDGTTITRAASAETTPPSAINPGTPNSLAKYVSGSDVGSSSVYEAAGRLGVNTDNPLDVIHSRFFNDNGGMTGLVVQNLASTASSYSGMLFRDQTGAVAQFQGFNNATHEYRINNVARNSLGNFDGSINFMLGGTKKLVLSPTLGIELYGPVGIAAGASNIGLFVASSGQAGISVLQTNPAGVAIYGSSTAGDGVFGSTDSGFAVTAIANTSGVGVYALANTGWAGIFEGDVSVLGTLYKGGGAFRIDHPLDPQNKYLSHSFVESPDMKNIYDGVAVFDEAGEATVIMPDWFEALNGDFRYQLTAMGAAFVPYVAEEISGNRFKVAGGIPGKKVSWQVTGIRRDAFANANRIQVEELKSGDAVGTYLHPAAFGLAPEQGRAAVDAEGSTSVTQDVSARRAEELKARLRAISQKPAKR